LYSSRRRAVARHIPVNRTLSLLYRIIFFESFD